MTEVFELLRRIVYECGTDGPDSERIRRWCYEAQESHDDALSRARTEARREGVEEGIASMRVLHATYSHLMIDYPPGLPEVAWDAKRCREVVERCMNALRQLLAAPEPGGGKSLERGGQEPGTARPGPAPSVAPMTAPPATSSPAATDRCPGCEAPPNGSAFTDDGRGCPDPFHDTPKGKAGAGGEGRG